MNELHLFAGAGGGILGSELFGIRTICAVELEPYPASVLLARQNDGLLPPFPVWDDVCTFDGRPWRGLVDVVSGGFPCQDISAAGKGAGIDGARSGLWREMHRIINEVRPEFAFLENSPLLVGRGLARVLGDLSEIGYDAEWLVLGADDVGAYTHEFTDTQHQDLLRLVQDCRGKVVLCGYDNALYNSALSGWCKVSYGARAGMGKKRVECMWMNYPDQLSLFNFHA